MNVSLYPTDLYHRTLPFAHVCVYIMHDTVHAHLPCPALLENGRMRQNKQNANKLKSIFISNNSFYLLQLKGCHKQHLIAIYVFFVEESIDARLVWQNIGKKMSSYGGALTVA